MLRPTSTAPLVRGPRLMDASPDDALASVRFDDGASTPCLSVSIPNKRLVAGSPFEVWPASGPVERSNVDGIELASDGHALFATTSFPARSVERLDAATRQAYARLLGAARRAGYPQFVRMWNFVPGINDEDEGLERYKLFCKGRSEAFHDAATESFPAASAVGSPGDVVAVHAVAARLPGRPVENPRQVSAYRYPRRYGPKSPTFARGIVAPPPWDRAVFVSGTASIAGHESLHPDDPAAQTRETMTNIAAVLDAAGVPGPGRPLGERIDALRVYVRHPSHLPVLRRAVEEAAGPEIPVVWLQAEICRRELLVEIEATVLAPRA